MATKAKKSISKKPAPLTLGNNILPDAIKATNGSNRCNVRGMYSIGKQIAKAGYTYNDPDLMIISTNFGQRDPLMRIENLKLSLKLFKKFTLAQLIAILGAGVPKKYILPIVSTVTRIDPASATSLLLRESRKTYRKRDYYNALLTLGATPPPPSRKYSMAAPLLRVGNQPVAWGGNNIRATIYRYVVKLKIAAELNTNDELLNSMLAAFQGNGPVTRYLKASAGRRDFTKRLKQVLGAGATSLNLK